MSSVARDLTQVNSVLTNSYSLVYNFMLHFVSAVTP